MKVKDCLLGSRIPRGDRTNRIQAADKKSAGPALSSILFPRLPCQWNICLLQRLVENSRRRVCDKKAPFLRSCHIHKCLKTLKADDEFRRHSVVSDADAMAWIESLHAVALVFLNSFLQRGNESLAGIRVFDSRFSYDAPPMKILRGTLWV